MAFLALSHHDPISLTDSIMQYEANDGCFYHLSHRISSRWMHLMADMSIIVDLVSRPITYTKPISIVVIEEGLISKDKNETITSCQSLIITHDAFEAQQYSYMLGNKTKHCLIKSQRKLIPKTDVIITPKRYASYLLSGTKFHRIIFPFNFNQRHLVFKTCKFSYSLSHFCIFYDWQKFQTFVLKKTFKNPILTFLKAIKTQPLHRVYILNDTFSCHACHQSQLKSVWITPIPLCKSCKTSTTLCLEKYKSAIHYSTVDQHLQKFQSSRCIIFDDRCQLDFYTEYPIYQQGLKKNIHVAPPLNIERCDTKAIEKIVIVCSIDSSTSSFVTSLRQVCHEQQLDIHVIYTHTMMKNPYITQFNT